MKIEGNRARDRRDSRRLRRNGWLLIRIWEHELKLHSERVTAQIAMLLLSRLQR